MRRARPPALERLADEELVELEHALDQLARPGGTPRGLPWETAAGATSLELVRELRTTGARQSRMASSGGGASTLARERPLPYVANANELAAQLHAAVAELAIALMRADERDTPGPRRLGPASLHAEDLATWLLVRLDALAWHPGIVRPHLSELRRLIAKGRATIDARPDRWYAGPCSTPRRDADDNLIIEAGAQAYCEAELWARPAVAVVLCRECGASHRLEKRRAELVRLAHERLETAHVISQALTGLLGAELKADRLYQWKRRGRITVRGADAKGNPLYRIGDVVDLLNADAARRSRVKVAGDRKAKP